MNLQKINSIAEFIRNGKSIKQCDNTSGLPITRIETISYGSINPDKVGFADLQKTGNEDWLLEKGDILISHINSSKHLGKCAIYEGNPKEIIHGMNLLNLRCKFKLADPRYIFYALNSSYFKNQIPKITKDSVNQSSFTVTSFKELTIPLPPLEEQKRIVAILDKADRVRRKRQEAIRLTEELGRSIFLDMFGDPVTNPKGWEIKDLKDVLSVVSGQVDPRSEPYIDMLHIGGENLESNTNRIMNLKTPRELGLISGKYLFIKGDVLYSKIRPYLNKVVTPDFQGICSADIYPLRVDKNEIEQNFLTHLLRSQFFLDYAEKHSTRTNIPKINRSALLSFCFPCPPITKQKQFSVQCNKIIDLYQEIRRSTEESENLFNSLLQRTFRGEL